LVDTGLKSQEIVGWWASEDQGRFTWKNERELIAMVMDGATAPEIAAKFKTSVRTIERKARALGISIKKRPEKK
jgi:DNA-binding NarL/FixJ family response regulator